MPVPIEDVRQTLRALLDDMDGKPSSVSHYDGPDKMFMLIAACAQLIEAAIIAASHTHSDALTGVQVLTDSIKRNIDQRYEEAGRPLQ